MSNSRQEARTTRQAPAVATACCAQGWRGVLWALGVGLGLLASACPTRADVVAGPAFSTFQLTLKEGERTEVVSPFYYSQKFEDITQWAIPPFMSYTRDDSIDAVEFDFFYPALSYDRFGAEYRFHVGQLFNFSGGVKEAETNKQRFAIFPIYMQQRSTDTNENYTSVFPFHGQLKNRLFRAEISYTLFPLYAYTRKRDVHTYNYLFPIVHVRHGDALEGWHGWPLVGHETKTPVMRTNSWGDEVLVPGHDKKFALWPLILNQHADIGGTNQEHIQSVIPFYRLTRSPNRHVTAIPFLGGWSMTYDREKKYQELGAPWPLVVFRDGETSRTRRVWPFYSRATNEFVESTWYLWPVYKYNRVHSDPLDRDRMRILLFLYSDTIERNTEAGIALRRRDFWPFYTHRRDWDGHTRLQVLAPLEPMIPNNKSIERNYSPLWSVWRDERNAKSGARSQSLLWNLYRRDVRDGESKTSAFFGLVQCASRGETRRWRLFYWPQKPAGTAAA